MLKIHSPMIGGFKHSFGSPCNAVSYGNTFKPNIFGDVSILCNCAEAAAKKEFKDETVQY